MTTLHRRSVLKALVSGAAACALPAAIPSVSAASASNSSSLSLINTTRTLGSGKAAMTVTSLGFGCMGSSYNRGATPDHASLVRLIRETHARGCNFFDTAEIYGPHTNELLTGEALEPIRNEVQIATKFGHRIENGKYFPGELNSRPEQIRRVCDESLKRLRTDVIDLFYQHRFDPSVPIEDVAGTVAELIREGKVRHWGLCEVGPETIRKAHTECPLTAIQSEYHLMWREPEKTVFPVLRELGIGFVPYSPLNRGFLGGDINEYTQFDPKRDNRQTLPRFTPENLRKNYRVVEVLHAFGRTHGMTAAQISLAWLLHMGDFIVPIPGTTKISHMEENLRSAQFEVSETDWASLEKKLAAVPISGDRYPASEQKQVSNK